MRIVIAPDSFKESLTAPEVAEAIAEGLRGILADATIELVPMADGGEGTVDALVAATDGTIIEAQVTGPLGDPVTAHYGILGDGRTAVIEVAQASGLALVTGTARDPMLTTSYGSGELIRHALGHSVERVVVGLGGSATNDGGTGLCQALGVRLIDSAGNTIEAPITGKLLAEIESFDSTGLDRRLADVRVEVACDVDNPLCGPRGASATFGPQKGATSEQVVWLDQELARVYRIIETELKLSIVEVPGAGAAGGLGAAMLAFLHAELRSGIDIVIDAVGLAERLAGADVVITGEGRIDGQTLHGKAPYGVAQLAAAADIPVVALGASLADMAEDTVSGVFDSIEAVVARPMTLDEAMRDARINTVRAGARIGAWLRLGRRMGQ